MDEETELVLWLNTLGLESTAEVDTLRDLSVRGLCDVIRFIAGAPKDGSEGDLVGCFRELETILDVALPGVRSHVRSYEVTGAVTSEFKTQLVRVLREIHRAGSDGMKSKEDHESDDDIHSPSPLPRPRTPPLVAEDEPAPDFYSPAPPPPPSVPPPPNAVSIQGLISRIVRLVPATDFLSNSLVDLSSETLSDGLLLGYLTLAFEKRMGMPPRRDAVQKQVGRETLLFLAGIEIHPRSRAAKLKNLEVALNVLRDWKRFSPRLLYSGPHIVDNASAEGLELIQQMVAHVERHCANVQDKRRFSAPIVPGESKFAVVNVVEQRRRSEQMLLSVTRDDDVLEDQSEEAVKDGDAPKQEELGRPTTPPLANSEAQSDVGNSVLEDVSFYSAASVDWHDATLSPPPPPPPPVLPHDVYVRSRLFSGKATIADDAPPPPPPYSPPPTDLEEKDFQEEGSSVAVSSSSETSSFDHRRRWSPRPFLHAESLAPPLLDPRTRFVSLRMTAKSQSQLVQFLKRSETVAPADRHAVRVWLFRAGFNLLRTHTHPHRSVHDQEAQTKQYWGYEGGPFLGDPLRNGQVLFEVARLLQRSLEGRSIVLSRLEEDAKSFTSAKLRVEFSMEALARLAVAHGLTRSLEAVLGEQARVGILSGGPEVWVILRALSIAFPLEMDDAEREAWEALACAGMMQQRTDFPSEAEWEVAFSGQIFREVLKRRHQTTASRLNNGQSGAPRTRKTALVAMERALGQVFGSANINSNTLNDVLPMGVTEAAARLLDGDIRLFLDLVQHLPLEELLRSERGKQERQSVLRVIENVGPNDSRRRSSWSAKTDIKSSLVGTLNPPTTHLQRPRQPSENALRQRRMPSLQSLRANDENDDEPSFVKARPPSVPRLKIDPTSTPISAIKPLKMPSGSAPARSALWSPAISVRGSNSGRQGFSRRSLLLG